MKATSFNPTGDAATALVQPDAVFLTVGALVNRILDSVPENAILIIDQRRVDPVIVFGTADVPDATVAAATTFAGLTDAMMSLGTYDNFTPGTGPATAPFEG